MAINSSDSHSMEEAAEVWCGDAHQIWGWLPARVRKGTDKSWILHSCSGQRHNSRHKLHNLLLSYLQARLNICLPKGARQTDTRNTNSDTSAVWPHSSWTSEVSTKPVYDPAANHCLQRAPSSCSTED